MKQFQWKLSPLTRASVKKCKMWENGAISTVLASRAESSYEFFSHTYMKMVLVKTWGGPESCSSTAFFHFFESRHVIFRHTDKILERKSVIFSLSMNDSLAVCTLDANWKSCLSVCQAENWRFCFPQCRLLRESLTKEKDARKAFIFISRKQFLLNKPLLFFVQMAFNIFILLLCKHWQKSQLTLQADATCV